jgi:hypothetical protein
MKNSTLPQTNKEPRSCLFYAGVTVLTLVVLGMVLPLVLLPTLQYVERSQATQQVQFEQPFLDQMPAYLDKFRTNASAPLQGKILVINPTDKTIDDLFYDLPRRNQAQTPAEVGVLVWMECRSLGEYSYGGVNFFQVVNWESCTVTLINWPSKIIVASQEFTGPPPPEEIHYGEESNPDLRDIAAVNRQDVVDWVLSKVAK